MVRCPQDSFQAFWQAHANGESVIQSCAEATWLQWRTPVLEGSVLTCVLRLTLLQGGKPSVVEACRAAHTVSALSGPIYRRCGVHFMNLPLSLLLPRMQTLLKANGASDTFASVFAAFAEREQNHHLRYASEDSAVKSKDQVSKLIRLINRCRHLVAEWAHTAVSS